MSEYRITVTDLRMALLHRGYTESQVAQLLGDIRADAWDEGAAAVNGRLTLTVDGAEVIDWESEEPSNPYRKEQHDE